MRDRIPPALPRAPPSFGACGGARTHTRTGPQHRSRPGYAGAWRRPGRQAARACHARSHPTSSTARATVLWRVWWRARPHPYRPAASFAPGGPQRASRPRLPTPAQSPTLSKLRHYQTERNTSPKDHNPQDICRLHRQHTAPRNQRGPTR